MKCPYCSETESKVVDKRDGPSGISTRRRRECLKCTKRYTTYERIENVELLVIKKDGNREQFDRSKLIRGMLKCCAKRPVDPEKIEKVVDEIEAELRNMESTEVPVKSVGNLVMKKLKKLDKVAYIRFASVYREFADLEEFQKELGKLLKGRQN